MQRPLLNIYRTAIVIQDRVCIGDTVQVKGGPLESRRGAVKKIQGGGIVLFECEFPFAASVGALAQPSCSLLICFAELM
jgi:hypothetical protein